jgi:uncharacterized protein YfaS (alpha-2-macroglobulin family)
MAQPVATSVTGHVEDSSGASMAGAKITLLDDAGTVKAKTATNSAGHTNTTPVPLIVTEGED